MTSVELLTRPSSQDVQSASLREEQLNASDSSSPKEFWRKVLLRLAPTISEPKFITWFSNTTLLNLENGVIVVGVPTTFAHKMLSEVFHVKILQAFQEIDPNVREIRYEVHSSLAQKGNSQIIEVRDIIAKDKTVRKIPGVPQVNLGDGLKSRLLSQKYTLDNFIVGKDNRLPHAACIAVANSPGGIYNPLFLFGGVGLGKTHLLQATGNEILKNFPNKKVVYLTSENFVNEVVEAIRRRTMNEFKARYRKVDVLIVDDVQFFGERATSQEEFFHTFNDLYDANKQLVLSSDRAPHELDYMDQRLKSRFGMGMVVEVLPPDFETRLAILQYKCQEFNIFVDREILEFIAHHLQRSVRELVGFLRQIVSAIELQHAVPTKEELRVLLSRLHGVQLKEGDVSNQEPAYSKKTSEDFIVAVAHYFKLTRDELTGPDRRKEIQIPRQICMYLIRQELNYSYERIGYEFGGRNHTTVLHAYEKVIEYLKHDSRLVRDINVLKKMLYLA